LDVKHHELPPTTPTPYSTIPSPPSAPARSHPCVFMVRGL